MSWEAILWAMKHAPTANINEYAVLGCYAEAAWSDGCDAFLAQATVAKRTHVDVQTVRRTVRALVGRGLMAKGDQRVVAHIPKNYRPVNYDLLIPYTWFPDVNEINEERKRRGRPPLTITLRPAVGPAPAKRVRRDAKPRTEEVSEVSTRYPGGISQSPLEDQQGYLQDTPEVSTRLAGGVSQTGPGCLADTQPCTDPVLNPEDSPSPSSVVTVTVPRARPSGTEGEGAEGFANEDQEREQVAPEADDDPELTGQAYRVIYNLPMMLRLHPHEHATVLPAIRAALAAGHRHTDLTTALAGNLPDHVITRIGFVLKRLQELPPAQAPRPLPGQVPAVVPLAVALAAPNPIERSAGVARVRAAMRSGTGVTE